MTGIVLFALKLTILLLLGAATAALLRKRSAAARHLVWTATLAGALLLPLIANVAPAMKVMVPVEEKVAAVEKAPLSLPMPMPRNAAVPAAEREASRLPSGETPPVQPARTPALRIVYLGGVAAMLLWLAAAHVAVRRIVRKATAAEGAEWDALIAEARERIRVGRAVRVALSARVAAPFTAGWVAPVILFPQEASAWPAERRRAALLHELAHVARNDAPVHVLAGLACALYWPHPAMWVALRRLRREGEQATDDRVIARGMIAPEYAAQLVDVARAARMRGFTSLASVAMACPSHLETRLRALLDESRTRGAVSRRGAAVAAAIAALVLVPLAMARPEARKVRRETTTIVAPDYQRPDYQRTVEARSGGKLVLDLETGASVSVKGGDAERVEVRAELSGDPSTVDTTASGSEVTVTSKYDETHRNKTSSAHDFVISVPKKFDVKVSSAGGGVTISDVDGKFEGSTGGGEINLTRVHGSATISTGGGDIEVTDSDLEGRVTTGGGTVRFERVRGGLRGYSGGTAVVSVGYDGEETGVARPARVTSSGAIAISKAGGAVMLGDAPHGAVINTGGGRVVVGRAGGDLDVTTGGGMIRLGPVSGSARASTGSGAIIIDVDDSDGDAQIIDVNTGHGRVDITLPASFDGRFDIETAYTEGNEHVAIDSDFALQREPVTGWDDRQGTPRRYVRAHGSAGSGRGLLRIRAVNGNVRIRRE
jgi:beta-lactamase regulating signal transducer with metallopeptidase domain